MERNNQFCVFHVSRWPRQKRATAFFFCQSRTVKSEFTELFRVGGTTWKRKHGKRGTPSYSSLSLYGGAVVTPYNKKREHKTASVNAPYFKAKKNTWKSRKKPLRKAFQHSHLSLAKITSKSAFTDFQIFIRLDGAQYNTVPIHGV